MESSNSKDPVCEVCKKKFKNSDNLSLHMRFHSLFGNFKKANSSESVLEEGNEDADGAQGSPPETSRELSPQSTLLVEKPFRCEKCGANFSSMRNKMQHDLLHAKRESGLEHRGTYTTNLKCSICMKRCRTENGLQKHFEKEHTNLHGAQMLKCGQCAKKFQSKPALDAHLDSDHPMEKVTKEGNDVSNARNSKRGCWMRRRFEMVINPRKGSRNLQMYRCKLCGALCFTMRSMHRHLKQDHKQESRRPPTCEPCDRTFSDEAALRRHNTYKHTEKNAVELSGQKNEDAAVQNMDVRREGSKYGGKEVDGLDSNGDDDDDDDDNNGNESFSCDGCGLQFSSVARMSKHLQESHSQRQMHSFLQLIRGYRKFRIHSNTTGSCKYGYQCISCKKRANTRARMVEHVKNEHKLGTEAGLARTFKSREPKKTSCKKSNAMTDDNATQQDAEEEVAVVDTLSPSHSTQEKESANAKPPRWKNKRGTKRFKLSTPKRKVNNEPCHCVECGVVLKTEWALEEHYKNRHSGRNFQVVPMFSASKGKYNLFLKCLICGKLSRSKGQLKQHLKGHDRMELKGNLMPSSLSITHEEVQKTKKGASKSQQTKRKRNISCIYHCRVCGESFPRLFNYSEHECKPLGNEAVNGDSGGNCVVGKESQGKREPEGTVACEKLQADDNDVEVNHVEEMILEETVGKDGKVSKAQKKVLLNRSPWKAQETPLENKSATTTTSEKGGKKGSKMLCKFCKRPFSNQKHLLRHEQLHNETSLVACSNCGMSFTAMHKLRNHSMRCMQNREVGNDAPDGPLPIEVSGGRIDGHTYPSYAKKSEYTYFDPANRSYHYVDYSSRIGDSLESRHGREVTEAVVGSSENKGNSSLDNIVIADVRSCNPAFSDENFGTSEPVKMGYPEAAVPFKGKNWLVPGELVPGYYLDGIQIPYVPVDGISPQDGALYLTQPGKIPQGGSPHGLYTQGTVFLVPYFVPAQQTLSNDALPLVAPKPASLPPGGFIINPNELNASFSPNSGQRIFPGMSHPGMNNGITVDRVENMTANFDEKIGLKMDQGVEQNCKYDCNVCKKTFSTFGNFIKHREVHRR